LVIAEHDSSVLNDSVFKVITAAKFWDTPIDLLVMGKHTEKVANQAAKITNLSNIIRVDADHLEHLLAEDAAKIIENIGEEYQVILAAHSWFSRNFLPRAAARLDIALISDVLKIEENNIYTRATYAGNVHARIQSDDPIQLLTIHTSLFEPISNEGGNAQITIKDAPLPSNLTNWQTEKINKSDRPALTDVLSPLVDEIGAALGATRAAVDAGYAPNEIQVGQTGVVVAPDLYIAVGVSGANQHVYGMKDSRVVVAINNDPDATIFQFADYGLVADLFEAVPEMRNLIKE
jgi:electron transfer flavoprotein alpha subunit